MSVRHGLCVPRYYNSRKERKVPFNETYGEMPFNPNHEYGRQSPLAIRYEELHEEHPTVQLMHQQAMWELPVGAVYEIRLLIPRRYGMDRQIAWYYTPGLAGLPPLHRMEISPEGGYIFFGLYRVEGAEVNVESTEDTILGP